MPTRHEYILESPSSFSLDGLGISVKQTTDSVFRTKEELTPTEAEQVRRRIPNIKVIRVEEPEQDDEQEPDTEESTPSDEEELEGEGGSGSEGGPEGDEAPERSESSGGEGEEQGESEEGGEADADGTEVEDEEEDEEQEIDDDDEELWDDSEDLSASEAREHIHETPAEDLVASGFLSPSEDRVTVIREWNEQMEEAGFAEEVREEPS